MGSYQTDDPRVLEVLRRRPPSGEHGASQGAPGVAEFPADWSNSTLLECITAVTGEPDHWLTVGSSTASFRDFNGVWVGALVRTLPGESARLVTAFPVVDGKRVHANPADPQPFLLNRTVETALDELRAIAGHDDSLNDQLWAGRALLKAGEPYEAAIWVVEMCADTGSALSEPVYSNLLLMTDDGYFDATYGRGFRKLVARQWKTHHPATWASA
ncbi:MAG: hypothetical protein LLG14_03995 [Nocardiaceae bacterium]|nr:hypothetical protein [Nocardiaceae bacterium]